MVDVRPKHASHKGVFQNQGYFFGGPHNKDYSILVYIHIYIYRDPLFWEPTIMRNAQVLGVLGHRV